MFYSYIVLCFFSPIPNIVVSRIGNENIVSHNWFEIMDIIITVVVRINCNNNIIATAVKSSRFSIIYSVC